MEAEVPVVFSLLESWCKHPQRAEMQHSPWQPGRKDCSPALSPHPAMNTFFAFPLCYFSPFHRRPENRGAKQTEWQNVCVCGMWSVSVVLFFFVNDLEECFLCVDIWLYRSRKEAALPIRLLLTGPRSVFTGKRLQQAQRNDISSSGL